MTTTPDATPCTTPAQLTVAVAVLLLLHGHGGGVPVHEVLNVKLSPAHIEVAVPLIGQGARGVAVTDPDIVLLQPMVLVALTV